MGRFDLQSSSAPRARVWLVSYIIAIVVGLLQIGCQTGPPNDLHRAAAAGDIDKLNALLAVGRDPNALASDGYIPNTSRAEGYSPLMAAAFEGKPDAVAILLRHGADPKLKDRSGATALFWAARSNASGEECLKLLLGAGADPNVSIVGNYTPLMAAVVAGRPKKVELLLKNGADPWSSSDWCQNAFDILSDGFVRAPTGQPAIPSKMLTTSSDSLGAAIFSANYRLLSQDNLSYGDDVKGQLLDTFNRLIGTDLYYRDSQPIRADTRWVIFIADSYNVSAAMTKFQVTVDGKKVGMLKTKGFVEFDTPLKMLSLGIITTNNQPYLGSDPQSPNPSFGRQKSSVMDCSSASGQTTFVRVTLNGSFWTGFQFPDPKFEKVDPKTASALLRNLRRSAMPANWSIARSQTRASP